MNDVDLRCVIASLQRQLAEQNRRIAFLEAERGESPGHDPRAWRRSKLRRAWRIHYAALSRSAAARAIACDWHTHVTSPHSEAEPGSLESIFNALVRSGCKPLSWRAINDDLDEALDA